MDYDITVHKGNPHRPAVIFIHGLGMDKRIWADPDEARMLGGRFPVGFLLSREPAPIDYGSGRKAVNAGKIRFSIGEIGRHLKTAFGDLRALKHTVLAWSQKRPAGPIDIAVAELKHIVKLAKGYSNAGIILIGHSRGGLVARKYLEYKDDSVRGLITLATPHSGSSMARWAEYISPLASIINSFVKDADKKKISYSIKRILDFISSKAIRELLPDSEFFRSLRDIDHANLYHLSVGGTNPALFSIYRWRLREISQRGRISRILAPEKILSVPDILRKIVPERFFPEELKEGLGDGLVTAKSAILPGCKEHYDFNLNHAAILFDKAVREKIVEAVEMA